MNHQVYWPGTNVPKSQGNAFDLRSCPGELAAQSNEPVAWTESYMQQVPDKCDRIVWRNRYYGLPPAPAAVPLSDDRILGLFHQAFVACADPMGKNNMTIAFARAIERAHGIGDKT